ncbi:Midasin [Penicillium riverlandense]|uniref:Midasin n=1 Tax=Penicillium riverlandense TaxID=1903569 RepID=UPI00254844B2|nr:Midasin [Penicillium riverlandense]KAJ5805247.1 Midasin [Penicillium riverlandense]
MYGRPVYERTLSESQLLEQLPSDLTTLIRTASGTQYLNAIALAALHPGCTESVFTLYEPIVVDLAARWLRSDPRIDYIHVLSAFARILPFAPHLRPLASQFASSRAGPLSALAASKELTLLQLDDPTVRTLLLALFRLLSFDLETFSTAVSPLQLQSLFQHQDPVIRYLAVRCFALYMHAADAATQKMLYVNTGAAPIQGDWEDITIDYRLLGLWEERRWETLEAHIRDQRSSRSYTEASAHVERLREFFTTKTAEVCGVLIPRLKDTLPSSSSPVIKTPTAIENLRRIATSLLGSKPILLVGLPNSGKTSLINDIAATMGQAESMVTLHLNEQTDAKSLLGMYATSSANGSFSWQPGVLTKAAREGRWVLIEDLDRAPSEVIGLILPIIERGELTIASRRERIKCAEGFRIIATMKSSYNIAGEEVAPNTSMLGSRLWQRVQVASLPLEEMRNVILRKFPLLESRVPTIMDVYHRVCAAFHGSLAIKGSQGRTPGFRDLIKLCSRLHRRLQRIGAKTGFEATPEGIEDEIFLDVVDVFLKYLPERSMQSSLAFVVAEALQISPQRAQFCLQERTPTYTDKNNSLVIGRESCQKIKVPSSSALKLAASASRFASTRAALSIMEQVAASIQMAEPVLLVGETGIGKTTVIQHLATLMRQKLTVVNLSQQSESTDLLGGFKPVNIRTMAIPMLDEFNQLFELTFSAKKNQKFLSSVSKSVSFSNWPRLVNLWHEAVRLADGAFKPSRDVSKDTENGDEQPSKKRKLESPKYQHLRQRWESFAAQLGDFEAQVSQGDAKFAFAFVQGKIVRALRNGEWVLLDEVNLASPDTLENIAGLLHHGSEGSPSVLLSEAGDVERVFGHPDFRIFGAMNPATDAGKRDLPPGLRTRFTEFYVHSPDTELDDLLALIQKYLGDLTLSDHRAVSDLAQLYMETKKLSNENKLTDGAGQRPHFSIRTLVRVLIYVIDHAHIYGLRRAIFEGFSMSFLTVLSLASERSLTPLLEAHIFGNTKNAKSLLGQTPRPPADGNNYVQFKHYWMRCGPLTPEEQPHYIITPFIEKNLKNLVRATSTRRFPVLLQGPTSAGKTSMIEYLAKVSGNKFVRINNHEHTDLQEYLGSYISSDDGSLRYQEGVLVEALRNGYWIVLDELNLAPSDVLEALNRLLDDNRELFIPETQEVVHPHPNFMLFATQNPAGLYGGRKVLSRAFRNRFLELHFDDIPESELEFILKERSQIAPSFCTRIVSVYRKLSLLRQSNRLFEQKNSFATLRDLFRWALRDADDKEQLAINGYMLLGERVRNPQEKAAVKAVIEEVMKVKLNEDVLYSDAQLEKHAPQIAELPAGIVWTKAMRRLFILVSKALQNNEPVLLVGETGCGKTQLCQAVAEAFARELFIVNAHVNLETGDLIGAQRPIRNRAAIEKQLLDDLRTFIYGEQAGSTSLEQLKQELAAMDAEVRQTRDQELLRKIEKNMIRCNALFEWSDGSLITAMKTGQFFLLDEISLADDSVLERLNSVLEPHRSILLAEKGPIDSMVVADGGFQFLSTMNPGGDYGKRELSAALRNRMTEIWAPQLSEDEDILPILHMKLSLKDERVAKAMLQFAKWFKATFQNTSTTSLSIRDLLAWVDFVNTCQTSDAVFAIVQGAAMVFVDTLGANPAAMLAISLHNLEGNRQLCLDKLGELFQVDASKIYWESSTVSVEPGFLHVGPFSLPTIGDTEPDPQFTMDAPTTIANSVRIARGLQSSKPILMEGSPGVGKTTLVTALARALGKPLTRINLSEQTDLTDLFGSDVPVEGGDVGQFTWRDAPFLRAMQRGDWVLLDEMNLASQSVLEGLNSCLDHRQQVYIAELDQTFKRHPDFVLFAAQNPHHQGGGRKGLPASFVNRFTVVYADSFTDADLKSICAKLFPGSPSQQTERLVDFISLLNIAIVNERRLGTVGGPWEVNLRDIQRWLQLADRGNLQIPTKHFLDIVISQRFRSEEDRVLVSQLYDRIFTDSNVGRKSYYHNLTPEYLQVGLGILSRDSLLQRTAEPQMKILPKDLHVLESLILCIDNSWPSILVGPAGCGKTTLIRKLAAVNGANLTELALSADTDTMDLIGGFEQIDHRREVSTFVHDLEIFLQHQILHAHASGEVTDVVTSALQICEHLKSSEASLDAILSSLSNLCQSYPEPTLQQLLSRAQSLGDAINQSDKMKVGFEWTEGVLTQAVQHGYWVVLDNANLCNPSVLDRLNSLTEPNGTLILNEQRTEDGSARIIKPHPNFRLFLTVDSRHGELSRAMRNRCVEICFMANELQQSPASLGPSYTCESSLYRMRQIWNTNISVPSAAYEDSFEVRLDHLSPTDLSYLQQSPGISLSHLYDSNVKEQAFNVLQRYSSLLHDNEQWRPLDIAGNQIDLGGASLGLQGSLQPLHPLVNEPLVSIIGASDVRSGLSILAYLQEFRLNIQQLKQRMLQADASGKQLKPSQMTRLERSLASKRIPSLMKDTTQPVGDFLSDCGQTLYDYIQGLDHVAIQTPEIVTAIQAVIYLCWDIFRATEVSQVDEGEFQVYLQIGRKVCAAILSTLPVLKPLELALSHALDRFQEGWALKTGLSMQRMWDAWRPVTPITQEKLQSLIELETTVFDFTTLALQMRIDLSQLSSIRNSLIDAQRFILLDGADADALVQGIKQTVTELSQAVRRSDSTQYPYFSEEFEALCQYHDLPLSSKRSRDDPVIRTVMPLLAGRPARPLDTSNFQSSVPDMLHRISLFSGAASKSGSALAVEGIVSLSLLGKLASVSATSLGQMDMLEAEKRTLSKAISFSSQQISIDQSMKLRSVLATLTAELVVSHQEYLHPHCAQHLITLLRAIETGDSMDNQALDEIILDQGVPNDHFFKAFSRKVLPSLIQSLKQHHLDREQSIRATGMAAVQLAVILLKLFVPDKPFDPSLGLVVQRKRHSQRLAELSAKSEAISSFELTFSGQSCNLRSDLLQSEIQNLGSAPPPSSVTRPQQSQLSLLQGEFANLINSVLNRDPEQLLRSTEDVPRSKEMIRLLRENIHQLGRRLSAHYRSYDDITVPVVRFLQLLDVGLSLGSSHMEQSGDLQDIQSVSERTPFLGGKIHPVLTTGNSEYPSSSPSNAIQMRLHELSTLSAAKGADSTILNVKSTRDTVRWILADFHALWKTKLKEDQEQEAAKSDLYRYKGSWEDEEEVNETELHQLFPTYEDDSLHGPEGVDRVDPRAISVRLASLHEKIVGDQSTGAELSTFVKESARLLGSMWSKNKTTLSPVQPQDHLPAVLLLLDDVVGEGTENRPKNYNFYTDSNLLEARKLVDFTLAIQSRFLQIQTAWPEHAVLQDVITCCTEILQFKHTEPVAKFLTKVEKLHSFVHEWQLVASREYSAASLYDEITKMTIGWRRLELSTWAKLLDLEKERCDENASSWWFIAYEALFGAPVQMAEAGETDLSEHVYGVISTLEQFFQSTTLGQFTRRLNLVANFHALLAAFVQDFDCLQPLVSALGNFLFHYRPFEAPVEKMLAEKRSTLEKDIKEQIQLASWKDTNIVALKVSARRSHVNLFKLVRKYRQVLGQSVQPVLEQGLPDTNGEASQAETVMSAPPSVFPEALIICQKDTQLWSSRALRFRNPDGTAGNMMNVYSSLPAEFDVSNELEAFTVSVIESIDEFKSQTPKTLTEENKDDVQHLKVQKRRLYADTLKRLFEMGVKRNAGTSVIETQTSLAQVLATSAEFEYGSTTPSSIQSADSYFHRLLDYLPRARLASRNYSEELSNVEVFRSMGSIEHLLFISRRQRGIISPTLSELARFRSTLGTMENLWTTGSALLSRAQPAEVEDRTDLTRVVAWLIPILELASTILQVHSKFSSLDASSIVEELLTNKSGLEKLRRSLDTLAVLPSGVGSKTHQETVQRTRSALEQLSHDLTRWSQSRPDLSFALDQIAPWVHIKLVSRSESIAQGDISLQSFDKNLLGAIDKMLIGLQQLKDVPSAIDFPGQLSRSDEFFARALKAVHLPEITSSLQAALDQIQSLQNHSSGDISTAAALVTSVLPIANRYYQICQDLTNRFISVHREVCKTSYILTKTFTQIASEGFCSPAEASEESGKDGKLESGTGLGDGEGAEDISKDVGEDEDLSELAQQEKKEDAKEEMDDSADAVNMDQEELQAETGEQQDGEEDKEKDEDGSEEEDNIDDEVGSVDDLDNAAVDEKLWDGDHDEQQKETENNEGKGTGEAEDQAAAQEQKKEDEKGEKGDEQEDEEADEDEEAPDDEGEAVGREDMDVTDPQTKEEDALDLPEEMQLDGDEKEGGEEDDDDGIDDMSDMGPLPEDDEKMQEQDEQGGDEDADMPPDEEVTGEDEEMGDEGGADEAEENGDEKEADGEEPEEPEQDDFLAQRDENEAAGDNVAESEAVTGGLGADQDQNEEKGASGDAQQESGSNDPSANAEQQTGAAKDSEESKRSRDAGGADDMTPNDPQMQAFKKLGDILEQWHRRQKEVLNASQEEEDSQPLPQDTDMADADFEHLKDDDDVADTQALGQASEDQTQALDQNKGVESDIKPGENEVLPDVSDDYQDALDNQLEDQMQLDRDTVTTDDQAAGAFIPSGQTSHDRMDGAPEAQEATEELDEVDTQLAAIHLSSSLPALTPQHEARRLWSRYESATNDLSLSLTEQLRLILAPTLATKLRGDFRTGKRLNIKRIIPYIASQYKRDKIWMRRSIPSKRNYQIMLAVDDSKSMLESGSGQLAFETLALVAKSLSMLEVGDLCVLGFGNEEHVRVAHEFGKPFSSEAGMQVFQHFSYQQTGTNVRKLIADSIALFREARWKRSPGAGSADLWQLELIISDGICEDHDTIRRLVRQALEERIMIVFIIVDAVKGSSILDLSQASFEPDPMAGGEMKLSMKRYLEGFPFPYYLVVRDVRELPAVLATALKQWFAEVVDVSS